MGHRAGLDGCGRALPNRDSIPGPSSPQRFTIPAELFQPTHDKCLFITCEKCLAQEMG